MSGEKVKVGVLGCTGMVGQRFVQLLESHPQFVIHGLGASARSAGKPYAEAARNWKQTTDIPAATGQIAVQECRVEGRLAECALVFSGLDSSVAGAVETAFADADIPVFSNSKNHRMDPLVPLIVPTVNPEHFAVIPAQRKATGRKHGFIVCNANCSTTGLAVALAPLHRKYGLRRCSVVTMQAVSGAGYPGLSVMDMADNVVPFISGEEDKVETEPQKILGALKPSRDGFREAEFAMSAQCNRVCVIDGHTECVSMDFACNPQPSMEDIKRTLGAFSSEAQSLALPSAPAVCCAVLEGDNRPQPRLDKDRGAGFTVSIGRVRRCRLFHVKFVLLSHNTIIGAAGSAILNAELAHHKGYLTRS